MVIDSLLDTDLYKFTMMQAVLHQYPGAMVQYRFKCRTPGIDLAQWLTPISEQIDHLCRLQFTAEELDYLRGFRFFKADFVDFLGLFRLNRDDVKLHASSTVPGGIELEISGPWLHTILFEVPLLAIINEVWFANTTTADFTEGKRRLAHKVSLLRDTPGYSGCRIADYGTRRRYSRQWHATLLPLLRDALGPQFVGTSNVHFARRYGLTPLGTMAHEYLQAFQALAPRLRDAQTTALESWAREYRGDLGIALSDVVGLDAFLRDFDMFFCKLFDGVRHDSGDPFAWGDRMLAHFKENRTDPAGKILVFSDGLDIARVMRLYDHFHQRCQLAFGVGTHLTNDLGPAPLNIVIKMVRCNGRPVAKLSDSPGKQMCDDPLYLTHLRQVFSAQA